MTGRGVLVHWMDNMEFYWEIVSHITGIAALGITGYLFYRFFKPFLPEGRYVWCVGAAYFVIMAILYVVPWEIGGALAYACGSLTAFLVTYFIDFRNLEQKLFLTVTMYLLNWISHGIVNGIPRNILFQIILYQPYVSARPVLGLVCYAAVECLSLVLRFLLIDLFIRIIDKVYIRKKENMGRRELAFMLIVPFLVLLGYIAFIFFSNVYLADFGKYIWRVHPQYTWIEVLYQILSFMGIIASIIFYQNIKENYRKEKENVVLSGQIADIKRHISEMEALYANIRGLKHDMGNHVMAVENLFLKNEKEEAIGYLSRIKKELAEMTTGIKTGNPVTDVILAEKQKEAKEKGIDFWCEFYYPEGTNIDVFDISVLLNNALDNAIEAAKVCGKPYIHIKSWRRKNIYMIEVRNNFSGILIMDDERGLPESTKGGEENGFGLANIRKVAQKYFGDIDIRQNEEEFVLSVLFVAEDAL